MSLEHWEYLPEEAADRRRRAWRRLRRRLHGWPAALGKSLALVLFVIVIWQITETRPPPRTTVVPVATSEPGAVQSANPAPLIHRLEPAEPTEPDPFAVTTDPPRRPPVSLPAAPPPPTTDTPSIPAEVPSTPADALEAELAPGPSQAAVPPEPAPRRPAARRGGEERHADAVPVAAAAVALLEPEAGEATPAPVPVAVVPGRVPSHRADGDAPLIAIVIDDVGPAVGAARRAIALPAPVTLSFLPYAEQLDRLVLEAARAGHEIMLHLPMEPVGDEDPGPGALLASLSEPMIGERVRAAIARVPTALGVNNHMGSRVTAMPVPMATVMAELRAAGLYFVDSRTTAASVAEAQAIAAGVPTTGRDVFLDNELDAAAIRRQLANTERIARRRGWAVAIGHPHAITLQILGAWIPEARRRGFELVPASRAVMLDECRNQRSDCSGLVTVAAP